MNKNKIPAGKNIPTDINVIIEIPKNSSIKYEIDKKSNTIFVDRFLFTPMSYPYNYGYIPSTLSDDGDPIDVLVISSESIIPGSVIRCRPIGILLMEDDGGKDEKIIAVPHNKITTEYINIKKINDLSDLILEKIKHFFKHYKDLEPNKWTKIIGFKDIDFAKEKIIEYFNRIN